MKGILNLREITEIDKERSRITGPSESSGSSLWQRRLINTTAAYTANSVRENRQHFEIIPEIFQP